MQRPLRKRVFDAAVTVLVAVLSGLVRRLPFGSLASVGGAVGAVVRVSRVRTREVVSRLADAGIPDPPGTARAVYRSLGTALVELLWTEGHGARDLAPRVTFTPRALRALELARERGAVIATAHVGSWDVMACHVASSTPLVVLTKRLSNASLDRRWQSLRAEKGVTLVSGSGALARCRLALAQRKVVALMIDQAPARTTGAVELPFLGRPAFHDLAPALLALRARVPLVVAWGTRQPDGSHVIDAPLVLPPPSRATRAAAVDATRSLAEALERHVRAHPDQWLWLHRRWKQPAPRGTRAAWTTPSASVPEPSARASSLAPASTRT